jgi:Flp pilus assembly protein TadG
MAELAVLLPVLIILVVGIIDWGFILFTHQHMIQAAREGVRIRAAEGPEYESSTAQETTEAYLERSFGSEFAAEFTVTTSESDDDHAWVEVRLPIEDASFLGAWPGDAVARVEMEYITCPPWCKGEE